MPSRVLGIMMLVAGVLLLLFGLNATDAAGEEIKEGLTGRYTDKTMWYLIGGAVLAVGGGLLAMLGGKVRT